MTINDILSSNNAQELMEKCLKYRESGVKVNDFTAEISDILAKKLDTIAEFSKKESDEFDLDEFNKVSFEISLLTTAYKVFSGEIK